MARKKTEKNELVGKNIEYLIETTPEMNKSKLANDLGVDVRSVRRWTNDYVFPVEYITDIATSFNISLDLLMKTDLTVTNVRQCTSMCVNV